MAKNELVSQNPSQVDSYRVTGKDFPDKSSGAKGSSSGNNDLVKQSKTQEGARYNAGEGPADWGKEGSAFSVSKNKGESSEAPSSPSIPESVNLVSGKISVKGSNTTKVDEVPDKLVHLGR